jgi:hypothetical protein
MAAISHSKPELPKAKPAQEKQEAEKQEALQQGPDAEDKGNGTGVVGTEKPTLMEVLSAEKREKGGEVL